MSREITYEEWVTEGTNRFGADPLNWRYVCPVCGRVSSARHWIKQGKKQAISLMLAGTFCPFKHADGQMVILPVRVNHGRLRGCVTRFEFADAFPRRTRGRQP